MPPTWKEYSKNEYTREEYQRMYTRFEFHVKEKTARKTISKRLQDGGSDGTRTRDPLRDRHVF